MSYATPFAHAHTRIRRQTCPASLFAECFQRMKVLWVFFLLCIKIWQVSQGRAFLESRLPEKSRVWETRGQETENDSSRSEPIRHSLAELNSGESQWTQDHKFSCCTAPSAASQAYDPKNNNKPKCAVCSLASTVQSSFQVLLQIRHTALK